MLTNVGRRWVFAGDDRPRHETPKESENSLHFKLPLLGELLVVTATLGAAQNPNNTEAQIGVWLK